MLVYKAVSKSSLIIPELLNKRYGPLILNCSGIHGCKELKNVYKYYSPIMQPRIFLTEFIGTISDISEDNVVTNEWRFIKEIFPTGTFHSVGKIKTFHLENGLLHHDFNPAIEYYNGTQYYVKNGCIQFSF